MKRAFEPIDPTGMLTSTLHLVAVACALGGAQTAPQQPGIGRPVDSRTLQRLDETLQDTGPLRTSLLLQPVDLRQPLGFDQVYRLPGGGADERLARISGGLAAVFPRSAYVSTAKGQLALVPPGTVFYIGGLPVAASTRPSFDASEDMRAHSRADTAVISSAAPELSSRVVRSTQDEHRPADTTSEAGRGIMTDEAYRAARVRQLLQTAAAGSQQFR